MSVVLSQLWVLVWKDVLIDLRRKENIVSMVFFALLTLLIFNFAIGSAEGRRYRVTPRVLAVLSAEPAWTDGTERLRALSGQTFNDRSALLVAIDALPGGPLPAGLRIAALENSARSFLREGAAGLLWVTVLLAGVLGLSRSFQQEREQACMDGLLLTPVNRGVLYLGKMLSNTLFLSLIQAVLLPMFGLFFAVQLQGAWPALVVVLLGGTLGFAALGTLLGGITASLKGREVLLPILLFPLLVPLVVVVVYLAGGVLDGVPLTEGGNWLNLLLAFDAVFLIVSYLVFEHVMES